MQRAYEICKVRGHTAGAHVLAANTTWTICLHCGTRYRYERMRELDPCGSWVTAQLPCPDRYERVLRELDPPEKKRKS